MGHDVHYVSSVPVRHYGHLVNILVWKPAGSHPLSEFTYPHWHLYGNDSRIVTTVRHLGVTQQYETVR